MSSSNTLKPKPGRRTPRTQSATLSRSRSFSKGTASSREEKMKFLKRSLQEINSANLRKAYIGFTVHTMSSNMKSFTGLDQQQMMSIAYGSTSQYLRQQLAGSEKLKLSSSEQNLGKITQRTPAYKTPEEYYDEVLALKKQIQELNSDNSILKLKVRRVEEEYIKKHRTVEQLLDPTKNEEIRRTLADSKPDSGMVVHSLKQKIVKLEQQLRDKEASYSKLQSDLKTTKTEEMKISVETLYNEVLRLKNEKAAVNGHPTRKGMQTSKDGPARVKELTATILKMSVDKAHLQSENKTLKEDLQKCIENQENLKRELDSRSKREKKSSKNDEKLDYKESNDGGSKSQRNDIEGKITLEGSIAQRLDQLDKRETELLQEAARQTSVIAKLKEDRAYYRAKFEEKENELKSARKEIDDLEVDLSREKEKRNSVVADRDRSSPRSSPDRSRRPSSLKNERENSRREAEITKDSRKFNKDPSLDNDAAELLQSTFRGHKVRQQNLKRMNQRIKDDDDDDDDIDGTADLIQSTLRGHQYRTKQLQRKSPSPSPRVASQSQSRRTSNSRSPRGRTKASLQNDDDDDDDDDDIILPQNKNRRS